MGIVEIILQQKELPSRYCRQATTGPFFIRMWGDTRASVISVRGWGKLLQNMRCPCNLKWPLSHLRSGAWTLWGLLALLQSRNNTSLCALTTWQSGLETKAIKAMTKEKVAKFLRENIFYKFGYPRELVTAQGNQFTSNLIEDVLTHHKIKHMTSTSYHPQANGQVEVTKRALEGILTKVVSRNRKYWMDRLFEATWAYNKTWKTTTRFTPYELVYGKKALLSIEFEFNTLRMVAQVDLYLSHAQKERLHQLNGLDEYRLQALLHTEVVKL